MSPFKTGEDDVAFVFTPEEVTVLGNGVVVVCLRGLHCCTNVVAHNLQFAVTRGFLVSRLGTEVVSLQEYTALYRYGPPQRAKVGRTQPTVLFEVHLLR